MSETPIDQLSFEAALERLESIIERIEDGEAGLEESLRQYESGMSLIKRCRAILDHAERRIAELTPGEEGELVVEGEEDGGDDE